MCFDQNQKKGGGSLGSEPRLVRTSWPSSLSALKWFGVGLPVPHDPSLLTLIFGLCCSIAVEFSCLFCRNRVPSTADVGGIVCGHRMAMGADEICQDRPRFSHGIVLHDDVLFISSIPWLFIRSRTETFLGGGCRSCYRLWDLCW